MIIPEIDVFTLMEQAYKIGMGCMIPYSYLESRHRFKDIKKGRKVPFVAVVFYYAVSTILVAIETVFWPAALIEEAKRIKKQKMEFDPLRNITVFNGFVMNDDISKLAYIQFSLYWHLGFRRSVLRKWDEEQNK